MVSDHRGLDHLVTIFLPLDPKQVDEAFSSQDEIRVLSASLGSFSAATLFVLSRMNRSARQDLCRRTAALSDDEIQPWMVEAAFRSVEGDGDALTGLDPQVMSGVHLYGLSLLSSTYLSRQECLELRPEALERARQYLPQLAGQPQENPRKPLPDS